MVDNERILIGKGEEGVYLQPAMANRHGLITGASLCFPRARPTK